MDATEALLMTLDNDRTAFESMIYFAQENVSAKHSEELDGTWTHDEAAKFHTADDIKGYVEDHIDGAGTKDDDPTGLIIATLVRCAFEDVDWHEVADHYIGKVKEGATV